MGAFPIRLFASQAGKLLIRHNAGSASDASARRSEGKNDKEKL